MKKVLSTTKPAVGANAQTSHVAGKTAPDIDSLVAKFTNMAMAPGNQTVQVMNNSKSRNSNAGVTQSFKTTGSIGGSLIANKYSAKQDSKIKQNVTLNLESQKKRAS